LIDDLLKEIPAILGVARINANHSVDEVLMQAQNIQEALLHNLGSRLCHTLTRYWSPGPEKTYSMMQIVQAESKRDNQNLTSADDCRNRSPIVINTVQHCGTQSGNLSKDPLQKTPKIQEKMKSTAAFLRLSL
jgi:hypothetical protein